MDFKDTKYGDLTGKTYDGSININGSKIKNLKGAPNIVKGDFECNYCTKLKNLKDAPKTINGNFNCSWSGLKNLKGAPEVVKGDFKCNGCNELESLDGVPKIIKGKFNCSYCSNLKTLDPLLKCDIGEVVADGNILKVYLKKKKAIEKHGWDKAMEIFTMIDELS